MPHFIRRTLLRSASVASLAGLMICAADLPAQAPIPAATLNSITVQRIYPNVGFVKPTILREGPGTGRLFVGEQRGTVRSFPKAGNPGSGDITTFLDISSRTLNSGEQGLLGLAFSPDFETTGEFYVYYTANTTSPGPSRVSRFTASGPGFTTANANTEEIILTLNQPFSNHNGGMIEFGPDGMLYIAIGDGGSANDPGNRAQDTTNLFGTILRIDVLGTPDNGLAYRIPPDNPFFSGGPAGSNTRREIYAYGLRNPYRFSFDPANGRAYIADVGQDAREEINVLGSGLNYGWKIREGFICTPPANTCQSAGFTNPIADYAHGSSGASVIGGFVYRGSRAPGLRGAYLFSDSVTNQLFYLTYNGTATSGVQLLKPPVTDLTPIGWGQDTSGEVYVLDYNFNNSPGGIYVFQQATSAEGWTLF